MNLLDFNFPEWFWVAFNLIVLVVVLQRILWKPVTRILDARQAIAVKTEEDAEAAMRLREVAEKQHARMHAEIETEATALMTDARSRAGREYDRIVAEAEERAKRIVAQANETAAQEKEKLLADAKAEVTAAALAATGILLRANMNTDKNKELVEVYLSEREPSA